MIFNDFCFRFERMRGSTVASYNWSSIGDDDVDPCEHGIPRCPHCNSTSISACDSDAVTEECQNQDVSTHAFVFR